MSAKGCQGVILITAQSKRLNRAKRNKLTRFSLKNKPKTTQEASHRAIFGLPQIPKLRKKENKKIRVKKPKICRQLSGGILNIQKTNPPKKIIARKKYRNLFLSTPPL